jgi:hypothetical protein
MTVDYESEQAAWEEEKSIWAEENLIEKSDVAFILFR